MKTDAEYAICLEAGVVFKDEDIYLCHWGAIVDRHQNVYFTNGPLILLPKKYRSELTEGKNLKLGALKS